MSDQAPLPRLRSIPPTTWRGLSLGLAVSLGLIAAGCRPGTRTTVPRDEGPVPTITLPATLPLPGTAFPARGSALGCAARSVAEMVYEDPAGKYCLVQPAESGVTAHRAADPYPMVTFIYPPAPEGKPEPRSVYLIIQDRGLISGTLEAAVDADIASMPADLKATLKRGTATLAGHSAVTVDGLPGTSTGRAAYLAPHGRLYHVLLQPWMDPAMTDLQPKAEAMWKAMAETLKFAP